VALQELVWKVRPDLIIETGIAHGGSLILSASLLALLDLCDSGPEEAKEGRSPRLRKVVGIDIEIRPHNRQAILAHPMANRIEMIEGSSVASDVIARARAIAANHTRVMVLLDSNHTRDHVLHELRAYAPLVSIGSYCVVYDTVVEHIPVKEPRDRPWGPGNSPMNSVDDYIVELTERSHVGADSLPLHFEIDRRIDAKLMISVAPRGYLKRV
jgi:cephalosporin hydroxylase